MTVGNGQLRPSLPIAILKNSQLHIVLAQHFQYLGRISSRRPSQDSSSETSVAHEMPSELFGAVVFTGLSATNTVRGSCHRTMTWKQPNRKDSLSQRGCSLTVSTPRCPAAMWGLAHLKHLVFSRPTPVRCRVPSFDAPECYHRGGDLQVACFAGRCPLVFWQPGTPGIHLPR
jgi:hypothetical protein